MKTKLLTICLLLLTSQVFAESHKEVKPWPNEKLKGIEIELNKVNTGFVATGQIGITITGNGIPLDAYKVDHACGAVEQVVLEQSEKEIVLVEGQGSLLHPGSTATLPLMRGSCPTHLILCLRAEKTSLRSPEHIRIPDLNDFIAAKDRMFKRSFTGIKYISCPGE